jgi:hypothetical protein
MKRSITYSSNKAKEVMMILLESIHNCYDVISNNTSHLLKDEFITFNLLLNNNNNDVDNDVDDDSMSLLMKLFKSIDPSCFDYSHILNNELFTNANTLPNELYHFINNGDDDLVVNYFINNGFNFYCCEFNDDYEHYFVRHVIHYSVTYGLIKSVQYLLTKGVDVNLLDSFKNTPLIYASLSIINKDQMINLLLLNGANKMIKNLDNDCAILDLNDHLKTKKYLVTHPNDDILNVMIN